MGFGQEGVRPVQNPEFAGESLMDPVQNLLRFATMEFIQGGVRPVQVMGFIQSWKVPGGFVTSQRGTCVVPRGVRTTTALGQIHLPEEACTFANGQRHGMDLGEEIEEPVFHEKKRRIKTLSVRRPSLSRKKKAWKSQGGVRPNKCWSSSSSSPVRHVKVEWKPPLQAKKPGH